jgi:hypothetical protein
VIQFLKIAAFAAVLCFPSNFATAVPSGKDPGQVAWHGVSEEGTPPEIETMKVPSE